MRAKRISAHQRVLERVAHVQRAGQRSAADHDAIRLASARRRNQPAASQRS
jgi:hypothetical protein